MKSRDALTHKRPIEYDPNSKSHNQNVSPEPMTNSIDETIEQEINDMFAKFKDYGNDENNSY